MRIAAVSMRRCLVSLGAIPLALSACSNEPGPPETKADHERPAKAAARPSEQQSAVSTTVAIVPDPGALVPAPTKATAPARTARRCGWLHNPTPANWWLVDRDGQWILGTQGADQAPGLDEMPDMSALDWQETNGSYGYGCACMTLTIDPTTGDVERVADAVPKPLAICRADKALPAP